MAYFEAPDRRWLKVYINGILTTDVEVHATSVPNTDPVLYQIELKQLDTPASIEDEIPYVPEE